MFDKFPKTKEYFPQFVGLTPEQLRLSSKMKAHSLGVMYMLTSYVENLDDPDTLVALVTKVSLSHRNRNITLKDFEVGVINLINSVFQRIVSNYIISFQYILYL